MVTYEMLCKKPQIAQGLIGMSLAEFNQFYTEFENAHGQRLRACRKTHHGKERLRGIGAGRKHRYELRDRLLMTLFWLKAYTTYELLGSLYGLDKTSIEDNLTPVLETLERMDTFRFERPAADRKKLHSVAEVKALVEICA